MRRLPRPPLQNVPTRQWQARQDTVAWLLTDLQRLCNYLCGTLWSEDYSQYSIRTVLHTLQHIVQSAVGQQVLRLVIQQRLAPVEYIVTDREYSDLYQGFALHAHMQCNFSFSRGSYKRTAHIVQASPAVKDRNGLNTSKTSSLGVTTSRRRLAGESCAPQVRVSGVAHFVRQTSCGTIDILRPRCNGFSPK